MANKFKCEIIPLNDIYSLCSRLAQKIIDSEYKVDIIIAIARGGFVPARLLCDFLDINDMTSVKVTHYIGTDKGQKASLKYPLNADIKGKNVLLVDDVNDTGKSIKVALDHLREFDPADIKTAVMHEKNDSLLATDYHVEYLGTWKWLIYEWAVVEDVGSFISKSGLKDDDAILKMLKEDYDLDWTAENLENIKPFLK